MWLHLPHSFCLTLAASLLPQNPSWAMTQYLIFVYSPHHAQCATWEQKPYLLHSPIPSVFSTRSGFDSAKKHLGWKQTLDKWMCEFSIATQLLKHKCLVPEGSGCSSFIMVTLGHRLQYIFLIFRKGHWWERKLYYLLGPILWLDKVQIISHDIPSAPWCGLWSSSLSFSIRSLCLTVLSLWLHEHAMPISASVPLLISFPPPKFFLRENTCNIRSRALALESSRYRCKLPSLLSC